MSTICIIVGSICIITYKIFIMIWMLCIIIWMVTCIIYYFDKHNMHIGNVFAKFFIQIYTVKVIQSIFLNVSCQQLNLKDWWAVIKIFNFLALSALKKNSLSRLPFCLELHFSLYKFPFLSMQSFRYKCVRFYFALLANSKSKQLGIVSLCLLVVKFLSIFFKRVAYL